MEKARSVIVKGYDIGRITSAYKGSRDFYLGSFGSYNIISVQIEWHNLTGELAAAAKVQQKSNDNILYADIPTLNVVMTSVDGTCVLEGTEWGGEDLNLFIESNGCTGGELTIVVVAKNK